MNRNFFLGCGGLAAALAVALIAATIIYVPRALRKGRGWVETKIAEVERIDAFERAWKPPSTSPDRLWFPTGFDGCYLISTSEQAGIKELQLERETKRALYRRGQEQIEVFVVAATALEKETLFTRAGEGFGRGATSKRTTTLGNQFYLRANQTEHTRLWWLKDWLFVFRSNGPLDPEPFMEKYLRAMQAEKASEPDCCPGESAPLEAAEVSK